MPAVRCPVPGCDYITADLDSAIVVALITAHSSSHSGGEAAKFESTRRPIETATGPNDDSAASRMSGTSERSGSHAIPESRTNRNTCPRICFKYNGNGCEKADSCRFIHMCQSYVESRCTSGRDCSKSHDIFTPSVKAKLEKHGINTRRRPREVLADFQAVLKDDRKKVSNSDCGNSKAMEAGLKTYKPTVPKICFDYNGRGCGLGDPCPYVHMCKSYIERRCESGRECSKSHDICDPKVKSLLEKHGIDTKRRPREVLVDFQKAMELYESTKKHAEMDISTGPGLPRPPRERQSPLPKQGQAVMSLSVFAPGPAGSPAARKQSQPASAQRHTVPQAARASSAHRQAATGRAGINREMSTDQNSRQVICFFHLRGRCAFGESCRNFHGDLPYQWLYKQQGEMKWRILPPDVNLEIELTYSDPDNLEYYMEIGQSVKVIFKTMIGTSADGQKFDIHRLSTSSSVEFERQPLTTVWNWYWKNPLGQWTIYGEKNSIGFKSNICSTDLEQAYIANPDGKFAFSTPVHTYILDFQKMVQRNIEEQTERDVSRRPTFMNKQDFEQKRMQLPGGRGSGQVVGGAASSVGTVKAPPHWQMNAGTDIIDHCQIVEILKTEEEYKEIEGLFFESMPRTKAIKSIERIENGDLWDNYVSKKARMQKKSKDVGERRLFHGTASKYVDAICRQGFDFRLSGQTTGTIYGQGSYFASTARYSDLYTDSDNKAMFIVKVLVGDYIQGKSEYSRPPTKDKTNPCSDLYDSCVDGENNPKIFVIFENGQVYPEYVVKYEYNFKL